MKPYTVSAPAMPLAPALFGATRGSSLMLVAAAVALLWVSAKVQIPLWPVPITMQTYVVLVIAMGYGMRLGMTSIGTYAALGALGLPVFAGTPEKGVGLVYLAGPTGGYVAGFIVAAAACGALAARDWGRTFGRALLAALLGHALIIGCGVAWLAFAVGWEKAIAVGVAPFAWGTLLKAVLVSVTLTGGAKCVRARR